MDCTTNDTVGLRKDRLRRRASNLHALAAALGAGLTVFAAVKLGERSATEAPLVLLGPLFLSLAMLSGTCLAYSLVKVQWQLDLLNRYLGTRAGGHNVTATPPIHTAQPLPVAWAILKKLEPRQDDRDCTWPVRERLGYVLATVFLLCAAVALLAYLWAPVATWGGRSAAQNGAQGAPPVVRDVHLRTHVFFEPGRSDLSYPAEQTLRSTLRALGSLDGQCAHVDGHADATGPELYNLELARMRGERVRGLLESEGLSREAIVVSAYGESRPVAPGRTLASLAQNRRVEIALASCTPRPPVAASPP